MTASDDAKTTRRERRREETRVQILEAAEEVFLRQGVGPTTISQIMSAADLGFGTFYNYFTSKEDAADAVAERMAEAVTRELGAVSMSLEDPAQAVAAMAMKLVHQAELEPAVAAFLLNRGIASGALERHLGGLLAELVTRGVASGRFPAEHAELAGWALGALYSGMVFFHTDGLRHPRFEEALAYQALGILGLSRAEAVAAVAHMTTTRDPTMSPSDDTPRPSCPG